MDFLHLYVEIKCVFSNFQKVLSEVYPISVYFTPSANSEVGFRFLMAGVSQSICYSCSHAIFSMPEVCRHTSCEAVCGIKMSAITSGFVLYAVRLDAVENG